MKYISILLGCMITFLCPAQPYKKLHRKAVLIDTHNDILTACLEHQYSFDQNLRGKTHSDLQRFKEGGVDVQIFSVWCDGAQKAAYAYANQQIDTLYATALRHPDKIMIATTGADLERAVRQKKLGAMIGVEGGHMIEDNLDNLTKLYQRGVRYMTLTWNNSTSWATSAMEETSPRPSPKREEEGNSLPRKGLSRFGKEVVQRMNSLGMIVDVSHVGEQTFWDVMATTTKPVIASHSSVYTLCPVFRNLKDDQIKAIGKNGGVIHLNFYSGFLDSTFFKRIEAFNLKHKEERDSLLQLRAEPYFADEKLFSLYADEVRALRAPFSLLMDHLDYIVTLIGVDGVGLGSDFDGISSTPQGLDDITFYPLITKELMARGYRKKDIKKILGGNFLRVFKMAQVH